jgi:hypothetical protein
MRLSDLRLIDGVERIPLGDLVEKYVGDGKEQSRASARLAAGELEPGRRPISSRYASRHLEIVQLDNGDVIITRPDNVKVRVYRQAVESALSDEKVSK